MQSREAAHYTAVTEKVGALAKVDSLESMEVQLAKGR